MRAIKEFGISTPRMSVRQSWLTLGLVLAGILLLAVVMIFWKRPVRAASWRSGLSPMKRMDLAAGLRPMMEKPKPHVKNKLPSFRRENIIDPETPNSEEQTRANWPLRLPSGESEG